MALNQRCVIIVPFIHIGNFMKASINITLGILIFSISACNSTKIPLAPKAMSSEFISAIQSSGLKIFSLKATASSQNLPPSKPRSSNDNITRWLEYELEQQLTNSQFCSNGHTEIERSIGPSFAIIRGECNELSGAAPEPPTNFQQKPAQSRTAP